MKTFVTVLLLVDISFVLWIVPVALWVFPVLEESPFNYFGLNAEKGCALFLAGTAVVSAIWGLTQPWRKMPYVFFLLVAPICIFAMGSLIMIYNGVFVCVLAYVIGRGSAWWYFRQKASPKPSFLKMAVSVFLFTGISFILGLCFSHLAEEPFNYSLNIINGVFRYGILGISVVWGFFHSWHKMPYALVLLSAPLYLVLRNPDAGPLLLPIVLMPIILCCAISYAVGTRIARALRQQMILRGRLTVPRYEGNKQGRDE